MALYDGIETMTGRDSALAERKARESSHSVPNFQRPIITRRAGQQNTMTVKDALSAFSAKNKSKVVLFRPPAVFSARAYSTPVSAALGPAYLAGLLEEAGYLVDVVDAIGEGLQNIRVSKDGRFKFQGLDSKAIIERIGPDTDVLGVSIMFSQGWPQMRAVIEDVKRAYPNLVIVAGGEHPTAMPEYILNDCPEIEYIITGEAELALLEFLHLHFIGQPVSDIPGLALLGSDGQYIYNGLSRRIADFANLPKPAWHLCHVENFFIGTWTHGIPYGRNMLILATRGCPYQCTFCSSPTMWTTRYVMRPATEVVDEIEWLIETYDANSFDFADLTAIVKKDWVLEFCTELKRRNLDIVWQLPSGTRSEALDRETLQSIYDAGCRLLTYAPESGSEDSLNKIKKKVKLKNLAESLSAAVDIGHTVKINLIVGFPHETRRHCLDTILFAIKAARLGIHDCLVSIFTPYPGSELFDELCRDKVIKTINDEYFNDLTLQFDLSIKDSYCKYMTAWETAIYRIIGMGMFYSVSFLAHPSRALRLMQVFYKSDFKPSTVLEQRLHDMFASKRIARQHNSN